ncbi:hypothetical protein SAMN05444000_103117 [Shimia gijangensis]|uniref:Phytanoyl-CoA dioxygenase (PhyH) n=1 Tax=Shimia gijangensis TaxID=1470563 RepID=A0A1M6E631_9RHOB|nr:hypothetical protein [Shimia gijangensis]SHI80829.1 hypothetical protein SAMN05444000_103117 [Shimia gijangensis]
MVGYLAQKGWQRIEFDPALLGWATAANDLASHAMQDPALAHWWVCEDTWFVGVDALENDAQGRLPDGTSLPSSLMQNLANRFDRLPFHKAQLSVIRPGYPKPRDNESVAAFRYRLKRNAAHVDGLKAEGPDRQRMVKEPHAYILGIPLNHASDQAAPLVIWEGSVGIMRTALKTALAPYPAEDWSNVDVTAVYQAARREVFETCERVTVHAQPGEAYLMHRLAVHGMASWQGDDTGDRRIAYFRPDLPSVSDWLERP